MIGETAENYVVDVFVYVLMGNHYHILLRTNRADLSKCMLAKVTIGDFQIYPFT